MANNRRRRKKRRRWGNRTGDLAVLDFKGPKWTTANGVRHGTTGYRKVEDTPTRNDELMNTSSAAGDQGFGRRIKDIVARKMNHRGMIKHRYGGYVKIGALTSDVEKHLRGYNGSVKGDDGAYGPSHGLLMPAERRLDVVLWRGGLAKTRPTAHQRCSHGHVRVTFPRKPSQSIKYPGRLRTAGTVVQVDPGVWDRRWPELVKYWEDPLNDRLIPPYLVVDLEGGQLRMERRPQDGERVMPSGIQRSLKSRDK